MTLCTHNPLGVKGCGEAGAIGAPAAIANAVVDALKPLGVRHVEMPATPERLWRAIQQHQHRAHAPSRTRGEARCTNSNYQQADEPRRRRALLGATRTPSWSPAA